MNKFVIEFWKGQKKKKGSSNPRRSERFINFINCTLCTKEFYASISNSNISKIDVRSLHGRYFEKIRASSINSQRSNVRDRSKTRSSLPPCEEKSIRIIEREKNETKKNRGEKRSRGEETGREEERKFGRDRDRTAANVVPSSKRNIVKIDSSIDGNRGEAGSRERRRHAACVVSYSSKRVATR